ncbi:YbhB/YbcL family Raf kinase inhibitor-like protein [Actinomadura violacea]|uniref:YbhB/YbcL family Raf kinase inhibitor-like protein n=1 Tax=Actinomadura violacea TaxID=2819934 RepID=A0ABS3RHK9_9ACTN|nr:YbhB/YbcL family Raf kinase inhibitor-like protein [Actinomadura violacea]MBO2456202.1 YbhB/YbcL family Raf kinase inhibitor-like protein [Actinomadura violacea]
MRKRGFTALTIAATAACATATVTVTAGSVAVASAQTGPAFGYHKVRAAIPKQAGHFRVTSPDLARGTFPAASYADTFGCTGGNVPPRLSWSGAPTGTRSFAVTMFDRDAPTGSGFWHWSVRDLPATAASVPANAAAGVNDAGTAGYQGPCPPAGDRPHHYEITVLALDVADAGVPATAGPAMASFAMGSHVIASAQITATAVVS